MEEDIQASYTGVMGLPSKFSSVRPGQQPVISSLIKEFASGKRFMVGEMPTGTGKTFIAMMVSQALNVPTIYVCTTKSLQEQFIADFPHAKLIKGRANYPCGRIPQRFPEVSAEDCMGSQCITGCPYARAKEEARKSSLVVANMAYFLNEVQYAKQFANRGFVVIDEADTLEDALLDQVSVQITQFDVEKMKLGKPAFKTKWEEWKLWGIEALKNVRLQEQALEEELKQYDLEENWATAPVALIREKKFVSRLAGKMGFFLKHVDPYWVWEEATGRTKSGSSYWKWIFKPVRVDQFGDLVWKNGGAFLLMSATILDQRQYERNVGLVPYKEEGLVGGVELQSTFPKERRPVIAKKGIDLTYKNIQKNLPQLEGYIREILDRHPNEKGVIHTVTFNIAQYIARNFPDRVIIHDSRTRASVIRTFKESKRPLVLVSPSVERGEDFPDDVCRFIVVVKLPFPYLGDPRVERRLYSMKDGQRWYQLKTISKLIQMTGRGMRHEEDYCVSYILDPAFKRLFTSQGTRSMFPKWWRESVIDEEKGGVYNAKREGQGQEEGQEAGVPVSQGGAQGDQSPEELSHGDARGLSKVLQGGDSRGRDQGRAGGDPIPLAEDLGDLQEEGSGDRPVGKSTNTKNNGWPKGI